MKKDKILCFTYIAVVATESSVAGSVRALISVLARGAIGVVVIVVTTAGALRYFVSSCWSKLGNRKTYETIVVVTTVGSVRVIVAGTVRVVVVVATAGALVRRLASWQAGHQETRTHVAVVASVAVRHVDYWELGL
jgi:hypothetical protein